MSWLYQGNYKKSVKSSDENRVVFTPQNKEEESFTEGNEGNQERQLNSGRFFLAIGTMDSELFH